jgi:hypothetical protein
MPTPSETVQRQLDAYNSGDIERYLDCFHPDACLRELQDGSVIAEGASAIRESFSALFSSCPELHAELIQRMAMGDTVVDHERVSGMSEEGPEETIAIYEVCDGRIRQVWFA